MREREFLQCQHFGCLQDQSVSNQSIPIVLPVSTNNKEAFGTAKAITLVFEGRYVCMYVCMYVFIDDVMPRCRNVAILRDPEYYPHRKEERCSRQWGTSNSAHPYIKVSTQ